MRNRTSGHGHRRAAARRAIGLALLLCAACALPGCATLNGAGDPAIERYEVVVESSGIKSLHQLLLLEAGTSASLESQRNVYLSREIIQIDERYDAFVRDLHRNRVKSELGTTLLNLALGVAGTLTDSTGVQKNYAAGTALVAGADVAVDKAVFYDKTVTALISAMEAQRARALLDLRRGMSRSLRQYPIVAAQADLYDYQRAGSLIGGLAFIEDVAGTDAEASERRIVALPSLTPEIFAKKACIAFSLRSDGENADVRLAVPALRGAVEAATGAAPDADAGRDELVDALSAEIDDASAVPAVYDAMIERALLIQPCPKDE